jgi:nucleotide-binding universal stress UspA family protein
LGSPDIEAVDISDLLRSMRELGEKSVDEAASLAGKKGLRADISLLPSGGRRASDVILDEARKWRADLIVMGNAWAARIQPAPSRQRCRARAARHAGTAAARTGGAREAAPQVNSQKN